MVAREEQSAGADCDVPVAGRALVVMVVLVLMTSRELDVTLDIADWRLNFADPLVDTRPPHQCGEVAARNSDWRH